MPEIGVELAHDLRMPLQLIYSCAQMIQLELGDSQQPAGQYASMLMDSVNHMQRMLTGALETCGRAWRPEPLRLIRADLAGCVRGLCLRCRPYAEQKDIALSCGGNVAALNMALDEDKLSRVLLNLISNAMRFTPRGGQIRVEWTALGDFAEISVADSGAGIAPERLPLIFLRGETDGGYGHGLANARDCARAMGGDISVRSWPGQGSTFTLRLPVRAECAG